MNQETINILVLVSPLIIGGIIAAINSNSVNDTTEKAEAWTRRTQTRISTKKHWFYRYVSHPILWVIVKFSDWTDSFVHRGLKNGVRVAISLYLIEAWCFILYTAVKIIVIIIISIAVLYIVFKILSNSNEDAKPDYNDYRKPDHNKKPALGSGGRGTRTNPDTGVIQKEGLFGWEDTDERINPETGKYQRRGTFGWIDSETRIDKETGNIQKEGFVSWEDTDTRVDLETGVIQKRGFVGWEDTDERIDPATGKHQKRGLFGWVDD